jgi:DNA-binding transcriptional regulator YiaG
MQCDTNVETVKEFTSTPETPYHYVGSGLSNVQLVGVKYQQWENGDQSAEIPSLPELLKALSKAIVAKKGPLKGEEVRFLRKRMGFSSKGFAELIGYNAQHFSRIENDATEWKQQTDLLIRLVFAVGEKLPSKISDKVVHTRWKADFDHKQNIVATLDSNHNWQVQIDCEAA